MISIARQQWQIQQPGLCGMGSLRLGSFSHDPRYERAQPFAGGSTETM